MVKVPREPSTAAPVEVVQTPPRSAVPQPEDRVLLNSSEATIESSVTELVADPVPPSLSVTVSVTSYVPLAGKVCIGVTPVAVAPSPKDQRYAVIVPSGSTDPAPESWQVVLEQLLEIDAVGEALVVVPIVKASVKVPPGVPRKAADSVLRVAVKDSTP